MGIVGDEAEDITNTILEALDSDCEVLLTSGGVSKGDKVSSILFELAHPYIEHYTL